MTRDCSTKSSLALPEHNFFSFFALSCIRIEFIVCEIYFEFPSLSSTTTVIRIFFSSSVCCQMRHIHDAFLNRVVFHWNGRKWAQHISFMNTSGKCYCVNTKYHFFFTQLLSVDNTNACVECTEKKLKT